MSRTVDFPSASDALAELRQSLRRYELKLDRAKRKRLGQFFSGPKISSLLAALSVCSAVQKVVDPMAGHGDLLDAVAARCALENRRVHLTALEIDPPTAQLARQRLALCAQLGEHSAELVEGNAFAPAIWQDGRGLGEFDLVIANPPYVRYQKSSSPQRLPAGSSAAADVRRGLRELVNTLRDPTERAVWSALIDGYSGLADLSIPSWLLCGLLVKPGGRLALVVPNTWMNRDYAKIVQYVQLRFFEPLIVVEEDGVGWFQDALVPSTLVVSRRLSAEEAAIPLSARSDTLHTTAMIAIPPTAASERSLVGRAFTGSDPDAEFAKWAQASKPDRIGEVSLHQASWAEQRQSILTRARGEHWLKAAGEPVAAMTGWPRVARPTTLLKVLDVPELPPLTSFRSLGFQVGQGLRTGCNSFFYVDALSLQGDGQQKVRVSQALGKQILRLPIEALRPVVRRQSDLSGLSVRLETIAGRVLDLRDWRLPEHCVSDMRLKPMPQALANLVRLAAQTAVGPPDRRVLIPELSAVRTNALADRARQRLLPGVAALRQWYVLPDFAPRHEPSIFVARVNSGTPWFIRNTEPPTLVDANFSTIYGSSKVLPIAALFAILNSIWCRACTELLGTPLGGGALKLEAIQIRNMPLPEIDGDDIETLCLLGDELARTDSSELGKLLYAIDCIVLKALTVPAAVLDAGHARLNGFIAERRGRRSRVARSRFRPSEELLF